MTHLESIALRHAKALGHAESILKTIRIMGAESKNPFAQRLGRLAAETEAEIARIMKEEPEE